jgi:ribosomal protein S18 acetylase RimI-like enzyme
MLIAPFPDALGMQVAPAYRRQHLAQKLMTVLEDVTEKVWLQARARLTAMPEHV